MMCLIALVLWFYLDRDESRVLYYLMVGLVSGIIIDFVYLRDWVNKRYELQTWLITGIYIFYNIMIYGMFMGFPLFNLLMSLVAGYYIGNRIQYLNIPPSVQPRIIRKTSLFTGLVMALICISSGFIALTGNGVGKELQGMLDLKFEVTKPMIWGVTLIGGVLLIGIQIALTRISILKSK